MSGKGDRPRNNGAKFRENYDGIDWGTDPRSLDQLFTHTGKCLKRVYGKKVYTDEVSFVKISDPARSEMFYSVQDAAGVKFRDPRVGKLRPSDAQMLKEVARSMGMEDSMPSWMAEEINDKTRELVGKNCYAPSDKIWDHENGARGSGRPGTIILEKEDGICTVQFGDGSKKTYHKSNLSIPVGNLTKGKK